MKTGLVSRASGLVITALLLLISNAGAQRVETFVKMKDLPEPVRQTMLQQSAGERLRKVIRKVENGNTSFEAEIKVNGRSRRVLIDETGAVLEIRDEIQSAGVPLALMAAIKKHAGEWKIASVYTITRNHEVVAYEAHLRKGVDRKEIKVGNDGKVISTVQTKVVVR